MAAEKVRIYDIARKLKLPNKEVMDLLEEKMKITVKSHSSTIDQADADKFFDALKSKSAPNEIKESAPEKSKTAKESPKSSKSEILPQKIEKPNETKEKPHVAETKVSDKKTEEVKVFKPADVVKKNEPYPKFQRPTGQPDNRGQVYQRPYDNRRPQVQAPQDGRPGFQRPAGQFPPDGRPGFQRPAGPPSPDGRPGFQRPAGQRPPFAPRKPGAPKETADFNKTPGRRENFVNKKKTKGYKPEILSKEEKLEQAKTLQDKFKKKKRTPEEEQREKVTTIVIDKPLTVGELSAKLDISISEIIKELMALGILATVNQPININTAKSVSEKLGIEVIQKETETAEEIKEQEEVDESKLVFRAPVVTIIGHVDHGKTTLLDAIRSTKHKIVNTEVGGITQSIGAYTVNIHDKKIVFLDTPGHEAFTAMRARGAQSTDVAILVVAADDGIMPQTIEAISHAKAAKVPIIVAVNKIDKAGADADKVLQQLTEYDLVPEKWGGSTVCVAVSALQGTNIEELLEMILLVSEIEDLKADPNKEADGVVIEAKLDKGKGAVATLLVQTGTLKVGDYIVVGSACGKVRALISDEGERILKAGPSTPVEILGLNAVPQSGDRFEVVSNDKAMKTIISERKDQERTSSLEINPMQVRRDTIIKDEEKTQYLNIIIKANTHGSAEAINSSIQQLKSKEIFVKIVHIGIGDISEADVMLASASNSIIIGFSVKEDQNAQRAAEIAGVEIRKYDIIYQILEDIEKTMLGLLKPEFKEIELGSAEVRQVFTVGKTAKIAGCYVTDGKIIRNKTAKVLRNGKEIHKGAIDQLKRFKDDAKEVASGFECGIMFNKFNDIEVGDIIKVSTMEEIEREALV